MIRYIIKNTAGKYLRRTKGNSTTSSWVDSVNDATLITTGSAASNIASQFCKGERYRQSRARYHTYPVQVIKVGVLLYPENKQPLMDGLLK